MCKNIGEKWSTQVSSYCSALAKKAWWSVMVSWTFSLGIVYHIRKFVATEISIRKIGFSLLKKKKNKNVNQREKEPRKHKKSRGKETPVIVCSGWRSICQEEVVGELCSSSVDIFSLAVLHNICIFQRVWESQTFWPHYKSTIYSPL